VSDKKPIYDEKVNTIIEMVNYPSLCHAQEGASKSISKVTELPGS